MKVPCWNCSSKCCRDASMPILLTPEDEERLLPEERVHVAWAPGMLKVSGVLARKEDGSCIFLRPWGCSVHPRKPASCAAMDPFACTLWEEDPEKAAGRIVLGVPVKHKD